MMSTRSFSRNSSLWNDLTPTMEPVVRWLNTNGKRYANPVPAIGGEPSNNALIAETGFRLAVIGSDDKLSAALGQANRFLSHLEGYPEGGVELDGDEMEEATGLGKSIRSFIAGLPDQPVFDPEVPGCGSVEGSHADILAGTTLIEVKSVTRPFRGQDIRQVLTYAALYYVSGLYIERIVFLNPRRGRVSEASIEFLCQGSSGQSRSVLMGEIVDTMMGLNVSA